MCLRSRIEGTLLPLIDLRRDLRNLFIFSLRDLRDFNFLRDLRTLLVFLLFFFLYFLVFFHLFVLPDMLYH